MRANLLSGSGRKSTQLPHHRCNSLVRAGWRLTVPKLRLGDHLKIGWPWRCNRETPSSMSSRISDWTQEVCALKNWWRLQTDSNWPSVTDQASDPHVCGLMDSARSPPGGNLRLSATFGRGLHHAVCIARKVHGCPVFRIQVRRPLDSLGPVQAMAKHLRGDPFQNLRKTDRIRSVQRKSVKRKRNRVHPTFTCTK